MTGIDLILSHPNFKVNLYNRHGETPIIHAASRGRTSILRLLLRDFEAAVNADSVDNEGCTPLARAAAMGHKEIVRMFLSQVNVTINSKDIDGYTPLV
ncbi:hypothetical protein N7450_007683 [Penicillium hetheringtonii]|uniref:Ankyrin n=1 Tax=Penicillium hetheringtonii TaxID=911720 RepID=A0AAD6DEY2_9EURO|nr:hypothetical protein N7450_007683 [Penicillium hetheringtonii]